MKRLSRTTIYKSDWVNLYTDKVELDDGNIIERYHQLDYPKKSVVILVTHKDEICLIRSKRYTTQQIEIELPAGYVEDHESLHEAAIREVREETGLNIESVDFFFSFYPSNGMSNQKINVFKAICKSKNAKAIDFNEIESIFWATPNQLSALINQNKISDGIAQLAILRYLTQSISVDETDLKRSN